MCSSNPNQDNSHKIITVLFLVACLLVGVLICMRISAGKTSDKSRSLDSQIQQILHLIETSYVDDCDADTLTNDVLNSILTSLDPHSHYVSAEEMTKQNEEIQGYFQGIGAILGNDNDTVCIHEIIPNSPSEVAGLRPGDRIIRIDTFHAVKQDVSEAVKRIRGPQHSKVNLTIRRLYEKQLRTISVYRNVIETNSLTYSGMLNTSTGYISLSRFSETTYAEFRNALLALKRQGMKELILDLRSNAGGLLAAAINIADDFLPNGDMIVYTEGAHQSKQEIKATRGGLFEEGKLIVMIDEFSASASEVVSGAIQDNDRGIIVGRRSFGKGLVQQQFELSNGGAVWLTIARYHTPSGRCIQRPYDRGTDEYYSQFLNELVESSLTDSILLKITDSTKYYTKSGKVVYGGGGIFPDKTIPHKKDQSFVFYNKINEKRIIYDYAFSQVSHNYETLITQYPNVNTFAESFQTSEAMLHDIYALAKGKGIQPDNNSAQTEKLIRTLLKAYIAQSLYGQGAFTRIYLSIDDDILTTLKLL